MSNLAICYILSDKNILSLFSGKWEFKILKAMEKVWKICMLGKKERRNPVWFPGKTRTWHRPRASEPHCSWSITLHPSPRCRISGQFVNAGECHCPSKPVHWVTQDVFSVVSWPQVSDVISTEFIHGQTEVLVTSLHSPKPKPINLGTVQSLCSQGSTPAQSQGLLSGLRGGRTGPLKMQAEQAHLIAKHCQVWAHICRARANLEPFQEPPWFPQTV